MSKKIRSILLGSLVFGAVCSCFAVDKSPDRKDKITAMKIGYVTYVRSYFSEEQDVLISIAGGANGQINFRNTRLIPATAPMDEASFASGLVFHKCGDDTTPWNLNGTYIGANHGCSAGREITAVKHGLTMADIGSEWIDDASNKFYIIKIPSPDTVLLLSENKSSDEIWKFNGTIKGTTLKSVDGNKTISFAKDIKVAQIIPACRIKEQKYLVDGKTPLEPGVVTVCNWLDIKEDYDIIAPDSLLKAIQNNPGKEPNFIDDQLEAVVNNQIVYKFLPMGTCMVEHNSTALRQFKVGDSKFVMTNPLDRNSFDSHSCYIPKTKPFESSTKYGNENLNLYSPKIKPFEEKTLKYDFKSIQDFARPIGDYLYFNKDKVEDPNNLPDRFIQFLGKTEEGKNVNKIGYVIGYSLSEGITRPEIRAKNVDYAVSINNFSCKIYPSAISDSYSKTIIPAGTTFHCLAYRQYFDPSVFKNATSVYWHKEADSYLLYIDYHKSVENDIIKLPEYLTGKKISLVEKTPSLKLLTEQTVPSDGIALSVSEQYGYIVLKLDDIK